MNDETRQNPPEPIEPSRPAAPAAVFTGRTPRKIEAVRAGIIVGTGLVLVIGAAVAMGASPAPTPSSSGRTVTVPGTDNGNGVGGIGQGGPGRPDAVGKGWGPGGVRGDGRGFGQISVTAVAGSNLTLATADGWTRTIAVTSATTITKGGAAATLADVAVGDTIRFAQTRNGDGTYTITAIEIVQPQVAGTVTAVGADSITITLRDGTSQTIQTTGSTAYHVEQADGTRADVTVGATIVATGAKAADGSLTASSVWVRLPRVAGTVTATSGDTITLSRRDGTTVTVHVGTGTTYRVAGVDSPSLSDVKAGMAIVVEGKQRADGSIDATSIGAGDLGKGRGQDGKKGTDPDASPAPSASAGTEG
jgi:endonuclease YncB( thermonuclease family)